ncbi:MAG: hypothetical protein QW170_03660 [Desulfurococcaceae archaeon]
MLKNIVSNILTISTVTSTIINEIYGLSKVVCALMISILILVAILELNNKWSKILLTTLSIVALTTHYIVLAILSNYIRIKLIPLVVIEINEKYGGGVMSIDFGQLLALLIIVTWRREIVGRIKPVFTQLSMYLKKVHGSGE